MNTAAVLADGEAPDPQGYARQSAPGPLGNLTQTSGRENRLGRYACRGDRADSPTNPPRTAQTGGFPIHSTAPHRKEGQEVNDSNWRRFAACAETDPELFFSPDGETGKAKARREVKAKKVCARCPVTSLCLSDAQQGGIQFGTWGGLADSERTAPTRSTRRLSLVPALKENVA